MVPLANNGILELIKYHRLFVVILATMYLASLMGKVLCFIFYKMFSQLVFKIACRLILKWLILSFQPHLLLSSLFLCKPYWPPSQLSNMPHIFPPEGFSSECYLCLERSFSLLFQVFLKMFLFPRKSILTTSLKIAAPLPHSQFSLL